MKIACFDVATVDYYPQQKQYYFGGNSLNQVVRLSDLGHQVAFIGAVGTDVPGDQIVHLLKSKQVDLTRLVQIDGRTAHNQIVNNETGERFGVEGAWQSGVYGIYKMDSADWTFLQSFDVWITHGNFSDFNLCLKKKNHQILCADLLHLHDFNLLKNSLNILDIAFIGGTEEMAPSLLQLSENTETLIVLTLGAEGSKAYYQSNQFEQEALPIEKVIDTTGCGDAFQAGFVSSYLQNRDIQKALLAGAELGRAGAGHYGGVSAVMSDA